MKVLIIGGTGLISTGIVKHLLARNAQVAMLNRGKRENRLPEKIHQITGDRNDADVLERAAKDGRYDVVIDMICFSPEQAEAGVRAFGGRCEHFMFCSTVCTYGVKVPAGVLVDETFQQEPISEYGRNKVASEKIFLEAHEQQKMKVTIVRPSCTYGPGGHLIDNLEFDPSAWDRIERGLPVLCAGDGLGLWVATHRDDVGKLFAYGALNAKTYGQAYNATRDENYTWRDHYHQAAAALGREARVVFMPAQWIIDREPERFGLLKGITQFHGAYSSEKAKRDVAEFRCEVDFVSGARQTLEDIRRRGVWRDSRGDELYQLMVDAAMGMGMKAMTV